MAPAQASTWPKRALTSSTWRSAGVNSLKFSKSVKSEKFTFWRTSASWSSPAMPRRCSMARAAPSEP